MKNNKLLLYKNISVENAFEKETQIIEKIKRDELKQCLILWQTKEATLVLPAGKKWSQTDALNKALLSEQWLLHSRKTGGAPVPQCQGIINLSHLYIWPDHSRYSITEAYENLCGVLQAFFKVYNLTPKAHSTEFSYCNGDYNLNINGKKIVGTAQRIILKKDGSKIVLAQAFILIDTLLENIIKPVNLCYQLSDKTERVKAEVHTTLFDHITERPTIDEIYKQLTQAFINSNLYT